ncbi:molecular chaperone TorD [Vibrio genomosp. F10]|uniref:molecular chaperone TorD n=1 Tax=Vibrio genomosp. F10 TaxID=723171 RepID=UPI0002F6122F|nr:molecular chaperone TorD [Vibrio genomosp. F10]OEF10412.1 molecular chaperone TorD [Vibrio genomosp. F10 str. 9ZB36]
MQETKAFNEKRAEIYWWLSSLFAKELTEPDIEQYQSAQIRAFLTGLGENPSLKPAIDKLVDALNRLQDREDAQLELSADFCDLFLKSDKDSALPYASIYIGEAGILNDTPAKEMADLMAKHNVAVHETLNEPADHIAIELDFLGHLIIRSNEVEIEKHLDQALIEQERFISTYLLSWVPQFTHKCQQLDDFGFYAAVSELMSAFLELDYQYLTGE